MTAGAPPNGGPPLEPDLRVEDAADYVGNGGDRIDSESRAQRRAAERAHRAERKRHRRRNLTVLGIIGALVVPFLVVGGWFVYQVNPPGEAGARVDDFVVETGLGDVGDRGLPRGPRRGRLVAGVPALRQDPGVGTVPPGAVRDAHQHGCPRRGDQVGGGAEAGEHRHRADPAARA